MKAQQNKRDKKKNSLLKSILLVVSIPFLSAGIIGVVASGGERLFRLILFQPAAETSFLEAVRDWFFLFFPIISVIVLITATIIAIKERSKRSVLIAIITVSLIPLTWFLGGNRIVRAYQSFMDSELQTYISYGDGYNYLEDTKSAVQNYRIAYFLDR